MIATRVVTIVQFDDGTTDVTDSVRGADGALHPNPDTTGRTFKEFLSAVESLLNDDAV